MRRGLIGMAAALVLGFSARAAAQTATPPTQPQAEPTTLKDRLKEPDQAGGIHFTEHFAVVFGGIKQGSGVALGPAFSTKFADGGFMQIKGVYSIRNFKLLQGRYDSRRFWSDRALVISRLRWQDAPSVNLYRLGPDSPDQRVRYAERKTEGSSQIIVKVTPKVLVASGFGIERYSTKDGRLDQLSDPNSLALVALPPGLGTRPWFAHTFATAGYDTRLSPDYSRNGHFFEAGLHDYHDVKDGQDSFRRVELTAQQLIPTHAARGVIDVSARTWLSQSDDVRSVPFFLMPTLGGGDLLKAYSSYRFRDRNALLLKGEYRWAVHKMVDVAGVYEAGKVAPTVQGLSLDNMAQSIAIGIRMHTDKAALFRADVAYGSDGVSFAIGFSGGG